jgi:hypothetical protein
MLTHEHGVAGISSLRRHPRSLPRGAAVALGFLQIPPAAGEKVSWTGGSSLVA